MSRLVRTSVRRAELEGCRQRARSARALSQERRPDRDRRLTAKGTNPRIDLALEKHRTAHAIPTAKGRREICAGRKLPTNRSDLEMKPFLFRLESVLALRAAKENQEQENYARAMQAVRRARTGVSGRSRGTGAASRSARVRSWSAFHAQRPDHRAQRDQLSACSRSRRSEGRTSPAFTRRSQGASPEPACGETRSRDSAPVARQRQQARHQRGKERHEQNAVSTTRSWRDLPSREVKAAA